MKTVWKTWALLGALGVVVAAGLGCEGTASASGEKRMSNADVSLISFGSVNGEVAPCG